MENNSSKVEKEQDISIEMEKPQDQEPVQEQNSGEINIHELKGRVSQLENEVKDTRAQISEIRKNLGLGEDMVVPHSVQAALSEKQRVEAEITGIEHNESLKEEGTRLENIENDDDSQENQEENIEIIKNLEEEKNTLLFELEEWEKAQDIVDQAEKEALEEDARLWQEQQAIATSQVDEILQAYNTAPETEKEQMRMGGSVHIGNNVNTYQQQGFSPEEVATLLREYQKDPDQDAASLLNNNSVLLNRLTELVKEEARVKLQEKRTQPESFNGGLMEFGSSVETKTEEEIAEEKRKEEEKIALLEKKSWDELNPEEKLLLLPKKQEERRLAHREEVQMQVKAIDEKIELMKNREREE